MGSQTTHRNRKSFQTIKHFLKKYFLPIFLIGWSVFLIIIFWKSYPTYQLGFQNGTQFFHNVKFILPWFLALWGGAAGILYFSKLRINFFEITLLSLVGAVTLLNIAQSFFPFSLGWDSANEYLLTTKLLAEEGFWRTGIFPSFVHIFLSFPARIFGLSVVQFILAAGGTGLWLVMIWLGQKLGLKRIYTLLIATTFFLIPAIQFQLSRDLKPDIFFLIVLLIGLGKWLDNKKMISSFLIGFSALLKLTAVWFFPFYTLLLFFQKISWKQKMISLFLLVLPLGIWMGVNFWQTKSLDPWILLKGQSSAPTFVLEAETSPSTSFAEEVERYGGVNLWDVFRSTHVPELRKQYTDLGFWWFAILPFFLFFFFKEKWNKEKELGFLSFGFFVCWVIWGEGVAWYGLPGLGLLILLSGRYFQSSKILKISYCNILAISIVLGIVSRIEHSYPNSFYASVSWAKNPTLENSEILSDNFFLEEKRAAEILNQDLESNIYRIGTMTKFWIHNPDRRILDDAQLDIFMRLGDGKLQKLQEQSFGYVLYDKATPSIEKNPEGSLHQKVDSFLQFTDAHLEEVFAGERLILFKIPRN